MEHLRSPQEVADYLGVPLQTVYRWRANGSGPVGFRVGKHVRYRLEDVDAWLEVQRDDRTTDAVA